MLCWRICVFICLNIGFANAPRGEGFVYCLPASWVLYICVVFVFLLFAGILWFVICLVVVVVDLLLSIVTLVFYMCFYKRYRYLRVLIVALSGDCGVF